jgi:hypothetical protein
VVPLEPVGVVSGAAAGEPGRLRGVGSTGGWLSGVIFMAVNKAEALLLLEYRRSTS